MNNMNNPVDNSADNSNNLYTEELGSVDMSAVSNVNADTPDVDATTIGITNAETDNLTQESGVVESTVVNDENQAVEAPVDEQIESLEPPKKKKKPLVTVLVILLILAGLGGGSWFLFKDKIMAMFFGSKSSITSKKIFENAFDMLDQKILYAEKSESQTITLSYTPSKDSSYKKFSLEAKVDSDLDKKYVKSDMNLKYDKDSISGTMYLADNNLYFHFKDIYDGYLLLAEDLVYDEDTVDIDTINAIKKSVLTALKKSLKDEYFSQTVEGDLTAHTLKVDYNNFKSIIKDLCSNIKNDADLVSNISDISDIDASDIQNTFDELIESLEQLDSEAREGVIYITIYTGNEYSVVKADIKLDDKTLLVIDNIIKGGFDYTLNTDNFKLSGKVSYSSSDSEVSLKITVNANGGKITFESTQQLNKDIKVDKIPEDEVKSVDDLNEVDLAFIQLNVQSNKFIISVMNDLSLFSSNSMMSEG